MKKLVSGVLLAAIYWSMFLPFALDAQAQVIGKTKDTRMDQIPPGLNFRLSEGAAGAESREVQPP
ncbi:MAG TPA: hypothetical protein PLK77_08530, partial [Pyrinomonadaceae bacterium]|nr:hypothetical protein [Pyrinomonadaceae bacterium]